MIDRLANGRKELKETQEIINSCDTKRTQRGEPKMKFRILEASNPTHQKEKDFATLEELLHFIDSLPLHSDEPHHEKAVTIEAPRLGDKEHEHGWRIIIYEGYVDHRP